MKESSYTVSDGSRRPPPKLLIIQTGLLFLILAGILYLIFLLSSKSKESDKQGFYKFAPMKLIQTGDTESENFRVDTLLIYQNNNNENLNENFPCGQQLMMLVTDTTRKPPRLVLLKLEVTDTTRKPPK
jgi:hypothetical protein